MTSSGPWSVKGIEAQAREAAKIAARRSGMTLGEWLNSAISEQAERSIELKTAAGTMTASSASSSSDSFERATSRLEDIAQQLASIARRETDASQYAYGAPAQRADNEGYVRLLNRLESNERQSVEAFSAVNERLSVLGRQFAQATKAAGQRPEDSQGFQTLEKAVRNIIEHMEASEKRNRDNFRSLQDRLAEMSAKAQTASSDNVLRQAPAFAQLESRLGDLARRVEQSDSSSQRGLSDLVRRELQDLTGRIESVRDTAEHLATRAQTAAVQASQQELQAIEARILGLLNEAQATFRSGGNSGDLEHLRAEIERLNARIDDARRGLASDQDVRALRQAVEQLSGRVQQNADSRPLVEMDRRIVELAQRLHDQQQHLQATPQLSDLDRRFEELELRLAEALQSPASNQAHHALQQQIAQVSERMDRTEKQITHFETIERAITQLYEGLEQTRNSAKQVAEDAASRVAQQFAGLQQSQPQHQPVNLAGAPEITALEQGLHALRESTQSADHRNQETLVAVHETLEHIVSKLSELETATIGQRVAAAVAGTPASLIADTNPGLSAADVAVPYGTQPQQDNSFEPENAASVAQEPYLEMPSLDSLDARMHAVLNEPQAPASAGAESKPADADDFIAAARRAALAAQEQKSVLNGIAPSAARFSEEGSKKLLGRFKIPFLNTGKEKSAKRAVAQSDGIKPMPEIKPAKATIDADKKRKMMIYGTLAMIIATAAIYNFTGQGSETPAPAATTAPAPAATPEPAAPAPAPAANPAPANTQGSLENGIMPSPEEKQSSQTSPTPSTDDVLTGSLPIDMTEAVSGQNQADDMALLPIAVGSEKLRMAASGGDPKAQFIVAARLLDGKTVVQDEAQAAYWFGKSAAAGLATAQYRLATMYERGQGVERNVKAALDWYERAAALGNVRSMHNAAVISAGNEAGAPDYARAFKWFSLASSHGLKDSQFNLAVILERGLGTPADIVEAAFWYSAAALQNDADARARADLLIKQLPSADAAAIKDRLASWKAQKAPAAANVFKVDETVYADKAT